MAEVPKLLYIVVVDEEEKGGEKRNASSAPPSPPSPGAPASSSYSSSSSSSSSRPLPPSFRYTRPVLQGTLQLMGCKARHAFKISSRVFEVFRTKCSPGDLPHFDREISKLYVTESNNHHGKAEENDAIPFEKYKRLTTFVVSRENFLRVVCDALSEYKIRERKESVTVLLCGTSGCGKSTLSALLGSRLGITTVISTDSIRHMMRSFVDEKQNPLLWASTYHAGEYLDPVAVAEAKARRKAKKLAGITPMSKEESSGVLHERTDARVSDSSSGIELLGKKQMAIEGFKAQSEMRQGSSRHLMALVNTDGSVAKAWPVESVDGNGLGNGNEKCVGIPMYGPLQIGKAEPVNLQFGNFGISAWPSDTGGTSHTGSIDESRADGTDTGSRYYSSCCSSPRVSDGHAKELKEEFSVSGSEEEAEDQHDMDSDEELSDVGNNGIDDIEGSVDEGSTKSDEEYDDLAMRDGLENGYWSDDDEEPGCSTQQTEGNESSTGANVGCAAADGLKEKYQQNLELFLSSDGHISEPPCSYSSFLSERTARRADGKRRSRSESSQFYSRPSSARTLGKQGSMRRGLILSGAP
ncbi:hypothetical protein Taro_020280 [Colocasia esculenta]|uniref:Uncharacterized protein n=1 Tax=Colocasia esculenta TaxID=4460 RepID=A0A843V4R5_COLES|nr:hypothetical protein [Colocasia esculenta]